MNPPLRNIFLLLLMLAAAGLAIIMRPMQRISDKNVKMDIEELIPHSFGEWREERKQPPFAIIDPLKKEKLAKLYTQTLSRSYVDEKNNRIMLSIAYGEDQRDGVQIHYPEVCYPAQGLHVLSNRLGKIETPQGSISVRRLETRLGEERYEPLTYWIMIGNNVIVDSVWKKLAELKYGVRGDIPDGLVFRVSSIEQDSEKAFLIQSKFILDLAAVLPPGGRLRLMGLRPEAILYKHAANRLAAIVLGAIEEASFRKIYLPFAQNFYVSHNHHCNRQAVC